MSEAVEEARTAGVNAANETVSVMNQSATKNVAPQVTPPPSTTGQENSQPPAFVGPSSFLRPRAFSRPISGHITQPTPTPTPRVLTVVDKEQAEGVRAIRNFLKARTSYDVLPLSFRLIILDTSLLVKKSLSILKTNEIVSAPLWDSKTSTFAGLLTVSDYINVIQYYWQFPDALGQIDQFRLDSLREVEKAIGVLPIETVAIHPLKPLYEACRRMIESRARRIPIVDVDDETQREMVVSVLTQYRILKFIAVNNVAETEMLRKPLKDLSVGCYTDLAHATMDTPVIEVIHLLVKKNIASVPILDHNHVVLNIFEAVDVITLIQGGVYDELTTTVGEAILKRPDDFAGIYTCSVYDRLDTIMDTIRKSRVHRLVVVDEHNRLKGMVTLSDILEYILVEGDESTE